MGFLRRGIVIPAAVGAGLLLAGCGAPGKLAVGDCLKEFGGAGSTSQVSTTSCARQHYGEVVGAYAVTADEFPGAQALADAAEEGCKVQFRQYVGVEPAASVYDLVPLTPSEASWNDGDYEVLCVARSATGEPLSGSLRQTGR